MAQQWYCIHPGPGENELELLNQSAPLPHEVEELQDLERNVKFMPISIISPAVEARDAFIVSGTRPDTLSKLRIEQLEQTVTRITKTMQKRKYETAVAVTYIASLHQSLTDAIARVAELENHFERLELPAPKGRSDKLQTEANKILEAIPEPIASLVETALSTTASKLGFYKKAEEHAKAMEYAHKLGRKMRKEQVKKNAEYSSAANTETVYAPKVKRDPSVLGADSDTEEEYQPLDPGLELLSNLSQILPPTLQTHSSLRGAMNISSSATPTGTNPSGGAQDVMSPLSVPGMSSPMASSEVGSSPKFKLPLSLVGYPEVAASLLQPSPDASLVPVTIPSLMNSEHPTTAISSASSLSLPALPSSSTATATTNFPSSFPLPDSTLSTSKPINSYMSKDSLLAKGVFAGRSETMTESSKTSAFSLQRDGALPLSPANMTKGTPVSMLSNKTPHTPESSNTLLEGKNDAASKIQTNNDLKLRESLQVNVSNTMLRANRSHSLSSSSTPTSASDNIPISNTPSMSSMVNKHSPQLTSSYLNDQKSTQKTQIVTSPSSLTTTSTSLPQLPPSLFPSTVSAYLPSTHTPQPSHLRAPTKSAAEVLTRLGVSLTGPLAALAPQASSPQMHSPSQTQLQIHPQVPSQALSPSSATPPLSGLQAPSLSFSPTAPAGFSSASFKESSRVADGSKGATSGGAGSK